LRCTYFPESRSGSDTSGIQVKGTLHWVSVPNAVEIEVRLYDRLFKVENPDAGEGTFIDHLNPESLTVMPVAYGEPELLTAKPGERYQFLRKGYFCLDQESNDNKLVYNRTVTLRDTWGGGKK
jgi:glutaminyl-tRNA synthetase